MIRRWRILLPLLVLGWWAAQPGPLWAQVVAPLTLVDYIEFPKGWEIRGDSSRIPEVYRIAREGKGRILQANISGEPIRIFKKIPWDPFTHPILEWKWRVMKWPETSPATIDLYISLDRDVLGIPTITKYIWSADLPVGMKKGRGFFSPREVVIRSGGPPGEWVTERLNVLENHREIYKSDPDRKAVGVGLLVGPGIEMEITGILALPAG